MKQYRVFQTSRRLSGLGRAARVGALLLAFVFVAHDASAQSGQTAPKPPVAQTTAPPAAESRPSKAPLPNPAPPAGVRPAVDPYRLVGAGPLAQTTRKPAQSPARKPSNAPRNVVTVVHRVEGIKLLKWLAAQAEEGIILDEIPAPDSVHTNIVAGVVSEDGKTVVVRLPRAAVEAEAGAVAMQNFFGPAQGEAKQFDKFPETPSFTVIRGDGRSIEAKFVGLDAATGLSFLEVKEPILSTWQATPWAPVVAPNVAPPAVVADQRVKLYAPAPAPAPPTAVAAPVAAAPPSPLVVGETGVVYSNIEQAEVNLTFRAVLPGTPMVATVHSKRITPRWTGAAVTNFQGELIGMLGDTGNTESELLSVDVMMRAKERVLASRKSVPRPLLGITGASLSKDYLEQLRAKGILLESIMKPLENYRGVLLGSVAPGTPASAAGLKPGDLITRVAGQEVRGIEGLTRFLNEAGAGAKLELEVLRAPELEPIKILVELSGTFERRPKFATRPLAARSTLELYGLTTVGLSRNVALRLGAVEGQYVVTVRPGSPAAEAGLRSGDVIEAVNGLPATRLQGQRLSTAEMKSLELEVVRQRERLTLKVPAPREH